MAYSDWKEITVNVAEVLLDYDNPRVFIQSPTQENLLNFLANEENAIELAKQIKSNRGLPLAEKPVLTIENGRYVVLEGNRRISACKLLLEPSLLSNKNLGKILLIDLEMKNYLKNLPVVLAPDRNSAEAFITMRHSGDKSVKKWSTIAFIKRFVSRFKKGETISDMAKILDETPSTIKNGIRFFSFLEFVRNEIDWSEDEKQMLAIYKLETTKLDRFLPFSRKAKSVLKIDFTEDHDVITDLPMEKFKEALKIIISRVYLKNGTKDEIDTRTKMENVFNAEIIEICKVPQIDNSGKLEEESGTIENSIGGEDTVGPGASVEGSGEDTVGPGVSVEGSGEDTVGPGVSVEGSGEDTVGPSVSVEGSGEDTVGPSVSVEGSGEDTVGPGVSVEGSGEDTVGPGVSVEGSGEDTVGPSVSVEGSGEDTVGPSVSVEGSGEDTVGPSVSVEGSGEDTVGPSVSVEGSGEDTVGPSVSVEGSGEDTVGPGVSVEGSGED
ncbi:hypothetical protein ABRS97_10395, partial [Paenibacillus sp. SI92]